MKNLFNKLLKSDSLQWKDVSSEKRDKRFFKKRMEKRTKINYDTEIIDVDLNFSEPPEPITVIYPRGLD